MRRWDLFGAVVVQGEECTFAVLLTVILTLAPSLPNIPYPPNPNHRSRTSLSLLNAIQKRLDLLPFLAPRRTRDAERVADARVRDVTVAADRLELRDVDDAALVQDVFAHVDMLHESENEGASVLSAHRVDDVLGLK